MRIRKRLAERRSGGGRVGRARRVERSGARGWSRPAGGAGRVVESGTRRRPRCRGTRFGGRRLAGGVVVRHAVTEWPSSLRCPTFVRMPKRDHSGWPSIRDKLGGLGGAPLPDGEQYAQQRV